MKKIVLLVLPIIIISLLFVACKKSCTTGEKVDSTSISATTFESKISSATAEKSSAKSTTTKRIVTSAISYKNKLDKTGSLSKEKIIKIKSDFLADLRVRSPKGFNDKTIADVFIGRYFGNFSGCEALFISCNGLYYKQLIEKKSIAGYEFRFMNSQPLYLYKSSNFHKIEDAYKNGLITNGDVQKLSEYFKA